MAQIDEDLNRKEIRQRRDGGGREEEVGAKNAEKNKCRWMAMDGWMDAGHAVATEKSLAAEWMAVIFFWGTYFRGCGGGDAEPSVLFMEILSY
jgi:hypothetical protein